jgi:hypothetical protein
MRTILPARFPGNREKCREFLTVRPEALCRKVLPESALDGKQRS